MIKDFLSGKAVISNPFATNVLNLLCQHEKFSNLLTATRPSKKLLSNPYFDPATKHGKKASEFLNITRSRIMKSARNLT